MDRCLMEDLGCKNPRAFPDSDTIGFCVECWARLPKWLREAVDVTSKSALAAEKTFISAERLADTTLEKAWEHLKMLRGAPRAPSDPYDQPASGDDATDGGAEGAPASGNGTVQHIGAHRSVPR